jgi:hypothetical protein
MEKHHLQLDLAKKMALDFVPVKQHNPKVSEIFYLMC